MKKYQATAKVYSSALIWTSFLPFGAVMAALALLTLMT